MTDRKKKLRSFGIPLLIVTLATTNYSRLTGTENVRAIHIVTLIAIGMGLGILLRNLISYFRGDL